MNNKMQLKKIGVDIDGVLNLHRDQFCNFANSLFNKRLNPMEITQIPVHLCNGLNITQLEEFQILNEEKYWTTMPENPRGNLILKKLAAHNFQIHIFTHRPWPQQIHNSGREHNSEWEKSIDQITEDWLKEKGIPFDRLYIEKSSIGSYDYHDRTNNRLDVCIQENITYFVEDDLNKANELADICNVVFPLDQPYNQSLTKIKSNIFRIASWNDLYKSISEV